MISHDTKKGKLLYSKIDGEWAMVQYCSELGITGDWAIVWHNKVAITVKYSDLFYKIPADDDVWKTISTDPYLDIVNRNAKLWDEEAKMKVVTIGKLRKSHFQQLKNYIDDIERDGCYWGNKAQHDKRHKELKQWVEDILETYERKEK
jgi:hypothetical protein